MCMLVDKGFFGEGPFIKKIELIFFLSHSTRRGKKPNVETLSMSIAAGAVTPELSGVPPPTAEEVGLELCSDGL